MAIIPQNVYYGIKTKYLNKFKIDYQGTVATISDLPEGDIPKGTVYNVEANGSNYLWNGEEWDELGSDDSNLVHKTENEVISGNKVFSSGSITIKNPEIDNTVQPSTSKYFDINFADKQDENYARIRIRQNTAGNSALFFRLSRFGGGYSDYMALFAHNYELLVKASIVPDESNAFSLGKADRLISVIYAATGSIDTSDERLKSNIVNISDTVLDAWENVSWMQYKFNDAVEKKGDNARVHVGLIAQRVKNVFEANGVDPSQFGFFCHDVWEAKEEERDEDGNLIREAKPAGDAYAMRYEEALCIEAAYQRRRADRLEARIAALEEKLK